MTTLTIGEAATLALGRVRTGGEGARAPHRTGAPVRRDSLEAGTFEALFFGTPAAGEPDRMLRAARAALDAARRLRRAERTGARALSPAERAIAALTAGAVRVYEELCTPARLNAGRVYPSYDWLAAATALGRATVARAIATLEAAGFLVRQRRFARVAGEGPGPRYEQTSNAYRPILPAAALALLPRRLRPAPPPADAVQREADRGAAAAAMAAGPSARELAAMPVGGALGRMLARLGAAIDAAAMSAERESHLDPEPRPKSSDQGEIERPTNRRGPYNQANEQSRP